MDWILSQGSLQERGRKVKDRDGDVAMTGGKKETDICVILHNISNSPCYYYELTNTVSARESSQRDYF